MTEEQLADIRARVQDACKPDARDERWYFFRACHADRDIEALLSEVERLREVQKAAVLLRNGWRYGASRELMCAYDALLRAAQDAAGRV